MNYRYMVVDIANFSYSELVYRLYKWGAFRVALPHYLSTSNPIHVMPTSLILSEVPDSSKLCSLMSVGTLIFHSVDNRPSILNKSISRCCVLGTFISCTISTSIRFLSFQYFSHLRSWHLPAMHKAKALHIRFALSMSFELTKTLQ